LDIILVQEPDIGSEHAGDELIEVVERRIGDSIKLSMGASVIEEVDLYQASEFIQLSYKCLRLSHEHVPLDT